MPEQEQLRTFNHRGWGFTRLADQRGAVRITTPMHGFQLSMEPETWASIVASLSDGGETHMNWRAALAFHQDAHGHGEPTHLRAARQQVIAALDAWGQARDRSIAHKEASTGSFADYAHQQRLWVEMYDLEERMLACRTVLADLVARHEASRSQGPEGADQADPADEQPRSGGDTSPSAAHSPVQVPTSLVTASNAIDGANAAPAAYVPPATPTGVLLTQPNVTGIAPASLHRLASLAAGDGDLNGLQGWFGRHAQVFSMAYRHADRRDGQEWRTQASVAMHDYLTTGPDLLPALRNLARQVLTRHGQIAPGEAL